MTEKIKTIDGQTLSEMNLPPTRFIIENLLPQGLHILAGAPKTGKSRLSLQMSLKVANVKNPHRYSPLFNIYIIYPY